MVWRQHMKPRALRPLGSVVPVEDEKEASQPASLYLYNWVTTRERRHERDSQGEMSYHRV